MQYSFFVLSGLPEQYSSMFHSCSHLAPMVYHEASGIVCYVSIRYAAHAYLSSDPNLHCHLCQIRILSYGQKSSPVGKSWEDA